MKDSGIYTKKQLVAMDLDDATITRMVGAGDLTRLRSGWYALRQCDATAASAVRDGGVLTCVDALRFYELWVPPGHKDRLHLRRSKHKAGRNRACRCGIGPVMSTSSAVDSIPIALKYASGCLAEDEWIAVADSYLNSTGTDVADLRAAMGTISVRLEAWLQRIDRRSQSGTESITRVRLEKLGYDVVVQPAIGIGHHPDLRIGLLLIECDSRLYHASKEEYERDHHRDRRALVDGWLTMRLTYDDILYDWEGVLADIREITQHDRHRARSDRAATLVAESVRRTMLERPPY